MKKTIATLTIALAFIAPLSACSVIDSFKPAPAETSIPQTRASFITPEVIEEINAPISNRVELADPIAINNVSSIDDVRAWVHQTCSAVKIATIPGESSYYLAQYSAIAVGEDTPGRYLPFVITHELSHHYQWIALNKNQKLWNQGLTGKEGAPPAIEVQADYMTFEVTGFKPEIANYAKTEADFDSRAEALRITEVGKSTGC